MDRQPRAVRGPGDRPRVPRAQGRAKVREQTRGQQGRTDDQGVVRQEEAEAAGGDKSTARGGRGEEPKCQGDQRRCRVPEGAGRAHGAESQGSRGHQDRGAGRVRRAAGEAQGSHDGPDAARGRGHACSGSHAGARGLRVVGHPGVRLGGSAQGALPRHQARARGPGHVSSRGRSGTVRGRASMVREHLPRVYLPENDQRDAAAQPAPGRAHAGQARPPARYLGRLRGVRQPQPARRRGVAIHAAALRRSGRENGGCEPAPDRRQSLPDDQGDRPGNRAR